jgi:hypothetical protein
MKVLDKKKSIFYLSKKKCAEDLALRVGAVIEKMPNSKWAVFRMQGVGNMRIKEYLRVDGEMN